MMIYKCFAALLVIKLVTGGRDDQMRSDQVTGGRDDQMRSDQLAEILAEIRDEVGEVKQDNAILRMNVEKLELADVQMQQVNVELIQENKDLRDEIQEVKQDNHPLKKDLAMITSRQDNNDIQLAMIEDRQLLGIDNHTSVHVAFMAMLSNTSFDPVDNELIPYDTSKLNVGNSYNTSTYTFTAPVRGVYYIYSMNRFQGNQYNYLYMRHNGSDVLFCLVHTIDVTSGNCAMLINMEAGDTADVMLDGTYGHIYGDPTLADSHFAGFLVQEIV